MVETRKSQRSEPQTQAEGKRKSPRSEQQIRTEDSSKRHRVSTTMLEHPQQQHESELLDEESNREWPTREVTVRDVDVQNTGVTVSKYTDKDNSENKNKEIFGSACTNLNDQAIIVDWDKKTMMTRLKDSIRSKWYGSYKFITCEKQAKLYLMDAFNRTLISKPTEASITELEFMQTFQNKVYTIMSDLRRNSQNLARKNYLSKLLIFGMMSYCQ